MVDPRPSPYWLLAFCLTCFIATYVAFTGKTKKPPSECSWPIYLQLDMLTMVIPIAGLALVPIPFGMPMARPRYRIMCTLVPIVTCFIAFIFSTAWDNLIASKGIWTFDPDCMVGVYRSIPYEEYAWFLLHTCLGQMVLARVWASSDDVPLPPRPNFPNRFKDWKIVVTALALLGMLPVGLKLMDAHSTFYLGVQLAFIPPVLSFMCVVYGHFLQWQPRQWWVPIVVESFYTIVVDQFAMSRGIWHIYDGSGIRFPISLFGNRGLQIEQFLIYTLTTVLVVTTLHPMLLITKAYYQWQVKRSFSSFFFHMLLHDGKPTDSFLNPESSVPLHSNVVEGVVEGVETVQQLPLASPQAQQQQLFQQQWSRAA